jgi:hypothetical protein
MLLNINKIAFYQRRTVMACQLDGVGGMTILAPMRQPVGYNSHVNACHTQDVRVCISELHIA